MSQRLYGALQPLSYRIDRGEEKKIY